MFFTHFRSPKTAGICREALNPFKTRIDVYETLCPQQMLVHKGGKIKNWVWECRDVTPTKLQSWGDRGQDGCERRIKVFVKIQKKKYFFFFFGGGEGWGGGGGGRGGGGQGGCEQRSEDFVKIQKKIIGGVRSGGGGVTGWM